MRFTNLTSLTGGFDADPLISKPANNEQIQVVTDRQAEAIEVLASAVAGVVTCGGFSGTQACPAGRCWLETEDDLDVTRIQCRQIARSRFPTGDQNRFASESPDTREVFSLE